MTAALEVRGLGYELPRTREGGRGGHLVQDVSFTVATGETLVLLGRSGSGKTTTLKLINRLLEPTAGEVLVAGERAAGVAATRLRRRIGYVIQEIGLFPHFSVERNVGLVPSLEGWPPERIAARVRELLALVGLDPAGFARRYPPFGAVDPITRVELQREFQTLKGRLAKGMVFVTHDVREGLRLGTRIGLMHEGRLAFLGTPEEFRASGHPEVRKFLEAA